MEYVIVFGVLILFVGFISWNWVNGIDYMKENHPDYKGEDLFDEWDDLENNKKQTYMQKTIIIDDTEYICSNTPAIFSDDEVIFEIVDTKGRMSYIIAGPTDLMGDPIKNIWFIETTNKLKPDSIFPTDMFYDDEYYKSTYFPTIEDEENLSKLSSDKNEHNN